jgi:hypothetical protein
MIRTLAFALATSALIAAPAAAGTAKLNIAGKTPEQVAKAVWTAAQTTCRKEALFISVIEAHRVCVVSTYRAAMSRSSNPQLVALANTFPES